MTVECAEGHWVGMLGLAVLNIAQIRQEKLIQITIPLPCEEINLSIEFKVQPSAVGSKAAH